MIQGDGGRSRATDGLRCMGTAEIPISAALRNHPPGQVIPGGFSPGLADWVDNPFTIR
jgi:hypothetical protein